MFTPAVMEGILKRQRQLERHQPKCPTCQSDQVQIMAKHNPAEWKCRICKHRFVSEPSELDGGDYTDHLYNRGW